MLTGWASADWHSPVGRKWKAAVTDVEYARFREDLAIEVQDDDGRRVLIRNVAGFEELWRNPRWVLGPTCRKKGRAVFAPNPRFNTAVLSTS